MPTYNPKLVSFSFKDILCTGFADDSFISAERAEDGVTMEVGAGGSVVVTESNNRTGTVTLVLQAAAPENDLLMAVVRSRELIGRGVDAGSLFIKDLNGTTLVECDDARIQKIPKMERGKASGNVEWVFLCTELDISIGSLL
jgi:hypothetical protein